MIILFHIIAYDDGGIFLSESLLSQSLEILIQAKCHAITSHLLYYYELGGHKVTQ